MTIGAEHEIDAEVWVHAGDAPWHFVTLPHDVADEIRARAEGEHRPFGSVPVQATIGSTTWSTSLFADTKAASYLLPVKAEVRRRERIAAGDRVRVRVALRP